MIEFAGIKSLLLDIEGTTTPIDFIYQKLFPFASANLEHYLATSLEFTDLEQLREEYELESASDLPEWAVPPLQYLRWLMAQDRKSRGLKSIQGKIWQQGYQHGELVGEVYSDVPTALRRWKEAAKSIYIYSSGSVQAQKLIFGRSTAGDLTVHINGYFDTAIGSKLEIASYRRVSDELGINSKHILFVSDVAAELAAAQSAGMAVCLSVRPGNPPQSGAWPAIQSFDELALS